MVIICLPFALEPLNISKMPTLQLFLMVAESAGIVCNVPPFLNRLLPYVEFLEPDFKINGDLEWLDSSSDECMILENLRV